MDKLDKLTVASVIVLTVYAAVLLATAPDRPRANPAEQRRVASQQYIANPELDNKIRLAKNLMAQDNLDKTETLVNSLINEYPYRGDLFMLRGDILMRRQQPVAAMYEYKEAIELNPDFLDKKTKIFQGKKIRITVEEAMAAIESGLQQQPGDTRLKSDRKTVYYMKRKLAGSCG